MENLRKNEKNAEFSMTKEIDKTSNVGSYYCCKQVVRCINPSPIPNFHPSHIHTQKLSKTLVFLLFDSIITNGPMDQQTDGPSDRQSLACLQLKIRLDCTAVIRLTLAFRQEQ